MAGDRPATCPAIAVGFHPPSFHWLPLGFNGLPLASTGFYPPSVRWLTPIALHSRLPPFARARQVLALLLAKSPPVAVFLAGRDLQVWSGAAQHVIHHVLHELPLVTKRGATCSFDHRLAFMRVTLRPLLEGTTASLVARSLGRASVPAELSRRVHERCGGNPAFLFALLEQLPRSTSTDEAEHDGSPPHSLDVALGEGSVQSPRPRRASASNDAVALDTALFDSLQKLPRRLEELVLAEIDQLSLEQQTVVKMASTMGMHGEIDLAVLQGVWPGSMADLHAAMQSTGVRQYLMPKGAAEPPDSFVEAHDSFDGSSDWHAGVRLFTFRNAASCEIIYQLMLAAQRQRLHGMIAEWHKKVVRLWPDDQLIFLLAYHAKQSSDTALAKRALMAAGRVAVKRGAHALPQCQHAPATTVCQRARALPLPSLPTAEPAAFSCARAGLYEDAEREYSAAVALYQDDAELEAAYVLAQVALAEMNSRYGRQSPDGRSPQETLKRLFDDLMGPTHAWLGALDDAFASAQEGSRHGGASASDDVAAQAQAVQEAQPVDAMISVVTGLVADARSDARQRETRQRQLALAQVCHSLAWAQMKPPPPLSLPAAPPQLSPSPGYTPAKVRGLAFAPSLVAEEYFRRAVSIRSQLGEHDLAAESLNGLATFYHKLAQAASADASESDANDASSFGAHPSAASASSATAASASSASAATVSSASSASERAASLWEQARVAIAESVARRPPWAAAQSLVTKAALYLDHAAPFQSVETALVSASHATDLYTVELGAFHPRLVFAFKNAAAAHHALGHCEQELCLLSRIRRIQLMGDALSAVAPLRSAVAPSAEQAGAKMGADGLMGGERLHGAAPHAPPPLQASSSLLADDSTDSLDGWLGAVRLWKQRAAVSARSRSATAVDNGLAATLGPPPLPSFAHRNASMPSELLVAHTEPPFVSGRSRSAEPSLDSGGGSASGHSETGEPPPPAPRNSIPCNSSAAPAAATAAAAAVTAAASSAAAYDVSCLVSRYGTYRAQLKLPWRPADETPTERPRSDSARDIAHTRSSDIVRSWLERLGPSGEASRAALRAALSSHYPELSFFVGMTIERDGHLVDGAEAMHEDLLLAMELAIRLHKDKGTRAWDKELSSLADAAIVATPDEATAGRRRGAGAGAAEGMANLDLLLILLVLTPLCRVALFAEESGIEVDELTRPCPASLIEALQGRDADGNGLGDGDGRGGAGASRGVSGGGRVRLPSVERLDAPSRSLLLAVLSTPAHVARFCGGEAIVGCCIGQLCKLRVAVGLQAACLALYHGVLCDYGATLCRAEGGAHSEVIAVLSGAVASVLGAVEAERTAPEPTGAVLALATAAEAAAGGMGLVHTRSHTSHALGTLSHQSSRSSVEGDRDGLVSSARGGRMHATAEAQADAAALHQFYERMCAAATLTPSPSRQPSAEPSRQPSEKSATLPERPRLFRKQTSSVWSAESDVVAPGRRPSLVSAGQGGGSGGASAPSTSPTTASVAVEMEMDVCSVSSSTARLYCLLHCRAGSIATIDAATQLMNASEWRELDAELANGQAIHSPDR